MKKLAVAVLALIVITLLPATVQASDHADPMSLKEPLSNITDLFFFPKGDQMILIFDVRRALTAPKPYQLEPFTYVVHMDLHSKVTYDDPDFKARYGGTVVNPSGISDDVTITFRLNEDTTVKEKTIVGLKNPENIKVWSGVRDDPFIFPRFFKKNTIAMVLSIPMSSFPAGQQDWILWGTSHKGSEMLDHVGRSNRSQLGRFDFLNTLKVQDQVPAILEQMKKRDKLYKFFNQYKETAPIAGLIQYVWQIRKYDIAPDVMIYTTRFPPGFPNGRFLPDDVVGQTCQYGDCILQELAYVEGKFPRQTVNDKPFLDTFPYLAEPWPDSPEKPPAKSIWPLLIMWLVIILILIVIENVIVVKIFCRRRQLRNT
jgi:hypothetical protein